ncbi:hypothetical protein PFLUV_G00227600 [Perca fluviatilis]|uniref:Uncharacterized protein n=1 Tax=Perca fluviatilis TaxID=8168 RepID=A0A6A5ECU5_PERFL|nr:hypothetical protein PFLUV_G00227600 [Perca fluviatilis]
MKIVRRKMSVASPAKKRNRNNHWVQKQNSSGHSAASPQPQRPTVQYHTAEGLDTPAQHIPRVSEQDISSCQWLQNGAYIGNETRSIEFKLGKGKGYNTIYSYT